MRSRQTLLAVTVVVSAATGLAGAASGNSAATISLSVPGNSAAKTETNAGAAVSLVARATLRSGDRILIVAVRTPETKARQVAGCSRSPCTGTWREPTAAVVKFQAGVLHGTGKTAKVVAESRILTVTWKAAASNPLAQPGHYEGRDSQNEKFSFDVTPNGLSVVNLVTGQINTSCSKGGVTWHGSLSLPGPYPIKADHTFSISVKNIWEEWTSSVAQRSITITGSFSGAIASGTLLVEVKINEAGFGDCSTGNQTWTIPRTG